MKTNSQEQSTPLVGQFFYYINQHGKFIRKITWADKNLFEWNRGWAEIDQLTPNENKTSNVKFILKTN